MAELVKLNVKEKNVFKRVGGWLRDHKDGFKAAGVIVGYVAINVIVVGGIAYFLGKKNGFAEGHSKGLEDGGDITILTILKDLAHLKLPDDPPKGVDIIIRGDELANVPLPEEAIKVLEESGYDPSNAAMLLCAIKATE